MSKEERTPDRERTPQPAEPESRELGLNKDTLRDLDEANGGEVQGGVLRATPQCTADRTTCT